MTDSPYLAALQNFWSSKGQQYTKDLLRQRIPAINVTVASDPATSPQVFELLLALHPDYPDQQDSDIDVRYAMVKNASCPAVLLEKLAGGQRESIRDIAQKRLTESLVQTRVS